ncbi:hypothetical protein AN642_00005 [Epulopiscium sp. SCG-B10WGA-EpuloA2]|nr:hypothetical protein AN642_00005 [Epulopiscium sp. SCG-B10WGA-EpuloA2]
MPRNMYMLCRNFLKSTDGMEILGVSDAFETPNGNWVVEGASNMPGGYILQQTHILDTNLMFF